MQRLAAGLHVYRRRLGRRLDAAAVGALAAMPAAVSDPLCMALDRVTTPRGLHERRMLAAVLGCSPPEAGRIAARRRANLLWARVDARRWLAGATGPDDLIGWEGDQHLRAACEMGRGVVIASVHTTAVAVLWAAAELLPRRGCPVSAIITNDIPRPVAGAWHAPLPGRAAAPRGALADLAAGRLLLVMADSIAATRRTLVRPFMGAVRPFPLGPAALARLAQAPVVPAVGLRTGPGRYTVRWFPAILPPAPHDRCGDAALLSALLDLFEGVMRAHPEQYGYYAVAAAPPQPVAEVR